MNKGPLIKLMRWFSVFERCLSWKGDFCATKMILESKLATDSEAVLPAEPVQETADTGNQKLDERQQLVNLKSRKGTWSLGHIDVRRPVHVEGFLYPKGKNASFL